MRKLRNDLKRLFVGWGKYYAIPAHWNIRQWISLVGVLAAVVVSAYFDEPIRYIFLRIHGPNLDSVFKFAHWFGTGYPTLYFFLGLYAGGLAFNSEKVRLGGLMVLQSYLYSGAITISLKSIVGRWRPAAGHGHLTFSPWTTTPNAHLSFPSGDVAVVFSRDRHDSTFKEFDLESSLDYYCRIDLAVENLLRRTLVLGCYILSRERDCCRGLGRKKL